MIDIDLLVQALRAQGHRVEDVHRVSPDAGEYEMIIDGNVVNLDGARHVLELDKSKPRRSREIIAT